MARILVVEDEPLITMMLEDWLAELGHTSAGPAGSVQAALTLIEEGGIDAAILDVNLAGSDCRPAAEALEVNGIPYVFATGDSSAMIVRQFPHISTLSKPYTFDAIAALLANLLKT